MREDKNHTWIASKSMTPYHLEATLFLKVNEEFWNAKLVSKFF